MQPMAQGVPASVLVQLVRDVGALRREVVRTLPTTVPPAALSLLSALRARGPGRVGELADDLRVDCSVVSRQAATLTALGWATRSPDPNDRRAHVLAASAAGEAVLDELRQAVSARLGSAVSTWHHDDVTQLATLLTRLCDDLRAAPAPTSKDRPA